MWSGRVPALPAINEKSGHLGTNFFWVGVVVGGDNRKKRRRGALGYNGGMDAGAENGIRETVASNVTRLLQRAAGGDSSAADALLPVVYEDLRALAGNYFRDQRRDHTLQPTALVHEAFLRLVQGQESEFENRAHFLAVAATAMRQILKDHARAKAADKRAPDGRRVGLEQVTTPSGQEVVNVVELDSALTRLSEIDPRMSRIVDLWFFGGLTIEEIAELQGVSSRTVKRLWRRAKAWLNSELTPRS